MKKILLTTCIAAAMAFAGAANAAILFSEDFSDEATADGTQLNYTGFDQFGVSGGTVDLILSGGYGITCETIGCVDLDGSTGQAGLLSSPLNFLGGVTYSVNARLSGNQRGGANDTGTSSVGAYTLNWNLAASDGFADYNFSFSFATDTVASLSFKDDGRDNIGTILDRVSITYDDVSAVPLPASALLLIGGLGGMGALRLRRRGASA